MFCTVDPFSFSCVLGFQSWCLLIAVAIQPSRRWNILGWTETASVILIRTLRLQLQLHLLELDWVHSINYVNIWSCNHSLQNMSIFDMKLSIKLPFTNFLHFTIYSAKKSQITHCWFSALCIPHFTIAHRLIFPCGVQYSWYKVDWNVIWTWQAISWSKVMSMKENHAFILYAAVV